MNISAHYDDVRSFAQIEISVQDRCKELTSDSTYDHESMCKKSARGSQLMPLTISYTFYTRITAYKKQGAPDRHSIKLLLLSARASPRIKSNGLHMYVLQIWYLINQMFKSFFSSADIVIDGLARPLIL
jgi:hypothetical protein